MMKFSQRRARSRSGAGASTPIDNFAVLTEVIRGLANSASESAVTYRDGGVNADVHALYGLASEKFWAEITPLAEALDDARAKFKALDEIRKHW